MSFHIHDILKQYWGFEAFRPLQQEIILSVLEGKDTLALLPTGGGKSVCFQVPALAKEGMCLVVSPLIALMKDQVQNLRKKGITAYAIHAGMTYKEVANILRVATHSNCKFLYVSPERLETSLFQEYLPGMDINLVAVDEAHCISQWGYDFRPPYLRIANLREQLPGIPILALTASATPEVQSDICERLHFKEQHIFRQSFDRPNLSYSVFHPDSKINKLLEILKNVPGSAIVYCKSRRRTKEISDLLQLEGIAANYYHAGLTQDERNQKQEDWIQNKLRVIVCTNAFGMGIDKPDVRTVVHIDMPDCLENYYQEAGRAGRDGKKAYAVLLYNEKDLQEMNELENIRFPSLQDIRLVYQAIANYLQIPSQSGEAEYYDFDFPDFVKKFKLTVNTALYAIKVLEQEGWLSFNEQVFVPAKVMFTATKAELFQFENDNPKLEDVIKSLLRGYEGIFDQPASISEKVLVTLVKKGLEEIKADLQKLHLAGIIDYQPQKDTPQIYFLQNRIKAEDLHIDMRAYKKRKEKFKQRLQGITFYVSNKYLCRSKMIATYFGEEDSKDCGICDHCIGKKAVVMSKEEFDSIHRHILSALTHGMISSKQLLSQMGEIKKEKTWKVLSFLQAENKIELDHKGFVKLK